jgi:hypothetical protein
MCGFGEKRSAAITRQHERHRRWPPDKSGVSGGLDAPRQFFGQHCILPSKAASV